MSRRPGVTAWAFALWVVTTQEELVFDGHPGGRRPAYKSQGTVKRFILAHGLETQISRRH